MIFIVIGFILYIFVWFFFSSSLISSSLENLRDECWNIFFFQIKNFKIHNCIWFFWTILQNSLQRLFFIASLYLPLPCFCLQKSGMPQLCKPEWQDRQPSHSLTGHIGFEPAATRLRPDLGWQQPHYYLFRENGGRKR